MGGVGSRNDCVLGLVSPVSGVVTCPANCGWAVHLAMTMKFNFALLGSENGIYRTIRDAYPTQKSWNVLPSSFTLFTALWMSSSWNEICSLMQ